MLVKLVKLLPNTENNCCTTAVFVVVWQKLQNYCSFLPKLFVRGTPLLNVFGNLREIKLGRQNVRALFLLTKDNRILTSDFTLSSKILDEVVVQGCVSNVLVGNGELLNYGFGKRIQFSSQKLC